MRYTRSIISLLLIALLIFGAIQFKNTSAYYYLKQTIDNLYQQIVQFIKVKKHNFSIDFFPERKRPLTVLDREARLQQFLPGVFGEFGFHDWQEFWNVIYEPIEEKQGRYKVKRYRDQYEMEMHLKESYPVPFSYFQKEHWNQFWNIVLGQ